jgi:tetratricopeptide (TPR) repeat protein
LIKRSPNEEIHQQAAIYFDELLPLAKTVDTSSFYSHTYYIGLIKYSSINDIENALNLTNEALGILEPRKNTNRGMLVNFTMQKMAYYNQLRLVDKDDVKELLDYCLGLVEEGDFNWFRANEVYFYHCMYSGQYEEALNVYFKITSSSSFNLLDGSHHDNWLLLGGYLHLIAKLGVLDTAKVESVVGTFKFGKFFNEIEVLDKDKEGMNIPLVLLPVLFHLAQKTFDDQNDISVDALEKYRQRWLANDMNRRSDSFLKMLIAFAKKDYASAVAEKKISKELESLKNETPKVAGQNFTVEVVPYETLWELLNAKGG